MSKEVSKGIKFLLFVVFILLSIRFMVTVPKYLQRRTRSQVKLNQKHRRLQKKESLYNGLKDRLKQDSALISVKYIPRLSDENIAEHRNIGVGFVVSQKNPKKDFIKLLERIRRNSFEDYIKHYVRISRDEDQFTQDLIIINRVLTLVQENRNFKPTKKDSIEYYEFKKMIMATPIDIINEGLEELGYRNNAWIQLNKGYAEDVRKYDIQELIDSTLCGRSTFDYMISIGKNLRKIKKITDNSNG